MPVPMPAPSANQEGKDFPRDGRAVRAVPRRHNQDGRAQRPDQLPRGAVAHAPRYVACPREAHATLGCDAGVQMTCLRARANDVFACACCTASENVVHYQH
eukprot:273828-Chlamydomonas_euryale.AAC.14